MVIRTSPIILTVCTLLTLIFSASIASAVTIKAFVDRNPVGINESFRLILEADGSPDDDPDFSPLQADFDIRGTNQSSSFNIVNGSVSRKIEWHLTLLAKRAGTLQIPSISFGTDRSPAIRIQVNDQNLSQAPNQGQGSTAPDAAEANRQIYIEANVDSRESYVQGQILYTVKLFRSVNLTSASLTEPEFTGVECLMNKIGDDKNYEKSINGVRYVVTERLYALFPQQSGGLIINPVRFEGQVATQRGSFYDPLGRRGQVVRQQSESIPVTILPIPQSYKHSIWLPSTGITLDEAWSTDPTKLKVGEPVTRTITLRGRGLTSAQLPEIELNMPDILKVYPDKPENSDQGSAAGIIGSRVFKYAIIPSTAGTFNVPAFTIDWWHTKSKSIKQVSVPARTLVIAEPSDGTVSTSNGQQLTTTAEGESSAISQNGDRIETPSNQSKLESESKVQVLDPGYWPWVSLLLAIGWATTTITLLKRRGDSAKRVTFKSPTDSQPDSKSATKLFKQLINSCLQGDAEAIRDALITWGRSEFGTTDKANLGVIADHVSPPLSDEIRSLQAHLYGRDGSDLRRIELKAALEGFTPTNREKRGNNQALPPLYPE